MTWMMSTTLVRWSANATASASRCRARRSVRGSSPTSSTSPVEKVHVTLAQARPELPHNQLTGGSNSTVSTYTPVRIAAAVGRNALLDAAAIELGYVVGRLESKDGVLLGVTGPKYGCGINVCKAFTSHVNGLPFNPCSPGSATSRPATR